MKLAKAPIYFIFLVVLNSILLNSASAEIIPGNYVDERGDTYTLDRGGEVEGRVVYRIFNPSKLFNGFRGIFASGDPKGNPIISPTAATSLQGGKVYGFSANNWGEPFCLGALISAHEDSGFLVISSYAPIVDNVSRNCALSNTNDFVQRPTHAFKIKLVQPSEDRSAPRGSLATLREGTYGDPNGGQLYRYNLVFNKDKKIWLFSGGDRKNNYNSVNGLVVEGTFSTNPVFSWVKGRMQLPNGPAYGYVKSGWGTEPFCDNSYIAILPIGQSIEVVSYSRINDRSSRSCMFNGPGTTLGNIPSGSIGFDKISN